MVLFIDAPAPICPVCQGSGTETVFPRNPAPWDGEDIACGCCAGDGKARCAYCGSAPAVGVDEHSEPICSSCGVVVVERLMASAAPVGVAPDDVATMQQQPSPTHARNLETVRPPLTPAARDRARRGVA